MIEYINIRIDQTQESVSSKIIDLKIHSGRKKERIKSNDRIVHGIWDGMRRVNIQVTGIQEGLDKAKGVRRTFKRL